MVTTKRRCIFYYAHIRLNCIFVGVRAVIRFVSTRCKSGGAVLELKEVVVSFECPYFSERHALVPTLYFVTYFQDLFFVFF